MVKCWCFVLIGEGQVLKVLSEVLSCCAGSVQRPQDESCDTAATSVPVSQHSVPVSQHSVSVSQHSVSVSQHSVTVSQHKPVSDNSVLESGFKREVAFFFEESNRWNE